MKEFEPVVAVFDKSVDLVEVDQFGFVDLHRIEETGSIPGSLAVVDESFNGVSDVDSLMPRPRDRFDALRQQKYVKSALAAAKAKADAGHAESATE